MKKTTGTILAIMALTITSFAQTRGINYKAIVKDATGNVIANDLIQVQFQIIETNATGNVVYTESHTPTTNVNGLIILNIGQGTVVNGIFNTIDWSSDDHFLNVQIDTGGGLTDLGTTQFMAVPYALQADIASNVNRESLALNDIIDVRQTFSSVFIGENASPEFSFPSRSVGIGINALSQTGNASDDNTAVGWSALENNSNGDDNVAVGASALLSNTSGDDNTAVGRSALSFNTTGDSNTAIGRSALINNAIGDNNTAVGRNTLVLNTTGSNNTAIGRSALLNNLGSNNTAIGFDALIENTTGTFNIALGAFALDANTTGNGNTATGFNALSNNTTGFDNTAVGDGALFTNILGDSNTAIGRLALRNTTGTNNTAIGDDALINTTTGSNNIGIGQNANVPSATGSNQIRMGNTSITLAQIQVGWSVTSDERWKNSVRKLPYGLNMVKELRPVDYIRNDSDTNTREMGFIAQEVEEILSKIGYKDQGFLTKDDNGYLSVRYNDFIALLTKALQEQQVIIDQQTTTINNLKASTEKQLTVNTIHTQAIKKLTQRLNDLETATTNHK